MARTKITEGNVRVALGDALESMWDAREASGYDPTVDREADDHLDLHLGGYNEDNPYPQLGIMPVSGQQQRESWNPADQTIRKVYDGRIDLRVYVGTDTDLPEHSQLLAERIGNHARDLVHNMRSLPDPHTGDRLAAYPEPLSLPRMQFDTELEDVRYFTVVEVGYARGESD